MSLPVVFRTAARMEYDAAADWYEQQRPGLGPKFVTAVRIVRERIADQPDFYPQVHRDVREAPVKKFPYCLYFRVENNQVVILSVFHASRDPAIWQSRS